MDTYESIRTIRAVREYEDRPVPEQVIQRILKAGRWTGSSKNSQPWQFVVVTERELMNRLAESGNYTEHLRHAALAIVILTDRIAGVGTFDSGRCAQNMMLAAWNDGVGSCIASMHRREDAEKLLGVSSDYVLQTLIAFGYPAPGSATMRAPRKAGRKPMDEMVHRNQW